MAKEHSEEAVNLLLSRYRLAVKSVARSYFLTGGDAEDLTQEGMIGLFKAINGYDGKSSGFKTFAMLCIKRSILSAIKTASRGKHKPLNEYISLYSEKDDDRKNIAIAVNRELIDPETEYINNEELMELEASISASLTEMETRVLDLYLSGNTYEAIGEKLGKSAKAADNAVQRIRKKIENVIDGV